MTEPNGPTEGEPPHENVVRLDSRVRRSNGVTIADVHEYTKGEVLHPLVNEQETGIAMALEEFGGITEPRVRPDHACDLDHRPNHMTLVPRGMPLWGHATKELRYSRYALLLFDLDALQRSFQTTSGPTCSSGRVCGSRKPGSTPWCGCSSRCPQRMARALFSVTV
jgi:hypothetical protein